MATYQVVYQEEPEGGYTVSVPALPGCVSYGKTLKQARERVTEAIQGYRLTQKKRLEVPSAVAIPHIALSTITV